ncbi:MAG TPA: M20 family metallopeptidase [Acidimicrobiales bacterium]|nr:M20 family metallopeptidase [Acidimicrobiales bacterium]
MRWAHLLSEAERDLAHTVKVRRGIHQDPEVGLDLPRTQARIREALDDLPLRVITGESCTSIVALLDGDADGDEPGDTILLRADMDALPMAEATDLDFRSRVDAMHSCGHDAHSAMLVGAARLLSARREQFRGRIAFMFQPGEEGHHGASAMLADGMLEHIASDGAKRPSMAFAIHQTPMAPAGLVMTKTGPACASFDDLRITIRGRGGHPSFPHETRDPLIAAADVITGLQALQARQSNAAEPFVITIGSIHSGTSGYLIPDEAVLDGCVFATSPHGRDVMHDLIRRVTNGVATAHGLSIDAEITDGYPLLVNHRAATRFVESIAEELVGRQSMWPVPNVAMSSEDFSVVLNEIPGTMVFLGTQPDGVSHPEPPHSPRMILNEDAMASGAALHASVALGWLDPARTTS